MPRLTVTVSEALAEKLSRMSEHYGVTVSRLVVHACDSTLHEGAPLSLTPGGKALHIVAPVSHHGTPMQRLVDRVTFKMPICAECTLAVKEEDIGPGDVHIGCPGRT